MDLSDSKLQERIKRLQDKYTRFATRNVGKENDTNSRQMYYAASALKELGAKIPDIAAPKVGLKYKPTDYERLAYKGVNPVGASQSSLDSAQSMAAPASDFSIPKYTYKPGEGYVKEQALKSGGKVGSASKRGDGCAIKGKTRGRMV